MFLAASIVDEPLNWQTLEQQVLHQHVIRQAKQLDKEQLLEIFTEVHRQYLLNQHLFKSLMRWCASEGGGLPSFATLLKPTTSLCHPDEQ